jgi:hypothetical protein
VVSDFSWAQGETTGEGERNNKNDGVKDDNVDDFNKIIVRVHHHRHTLKSVVVEVRDGDCTVNIYIPLYYLQIKLQKNK